MTRWLLSLLLVGGCAPSDSLPRVILVPDSLKEQVKELPGYKPCHVQWCPAMNAWMNYDNWITCPGPLHELPICEVIYIPQDAHCFQRVDGTTGVQCP